MARRLFFCVAAVLALGACNVNLAGRATDEWTRTYPLAPGGTLQIGNTNGRIDVEGTDGSTVEVRAERIAKGTTDAAASELLPRIKINESAKPDRIVLETEHIAGIMIGASVEVRYHVRAPKGATLELTNTNGLIDLKGLTGAVRAHTTNGGVRGSGLSGGVDASTTNGAVRLDFASVGKDPIRLSTTNGGVTVNLPPDAKADLVATCTNGGIAVEDVKMEMVEQSRRRVEGKMNGGGASIELKTTNGGIRIRGRGDRSDAQTSPDERR
jgi:hypothetical protein